MKLVGNCKQEFENWYRKTYYETLRDTPFKLQLLVFYSLPLSKQFGVYVDFFDSVNIYIDMVYNGINWGFAGDIEANGDNEVLPHRNTRGETRTEAIKKANELYNIK